MKRLTDEILLDAIQCLWVVDGYPPTTEAIIGELIFFNKKQVHVALQRAKKRGKLMAHRERWVHS
ncbi:hypothetical protein [Thalassomonas sp. M1454]|uniref:hypothetical protein n=1 Tax=Thalassomonas sp. M1454 TaxID=2594477 RepID=UPI00117F22E9|nr:hypothetical protein [Thalassomonas sp. M1454]TRX53464.1 hypothetical protein FNN08_14415 [Thalassomonas sp. M1454]